MFGLTWGTAAVIFLVGWGSGVRSMLERGFFKTGRDMGTVWAGRIGEDFTPGIDRRFLWFNLEDVVALRARTQYVDVVGAEAWEMLPAAFRQRLVNVDVRGIDPEAMVIRGVGISAGRGITYSDVEQRRRVILLGERTRKRLLGPSGALGSWIRLGGIPFRVVGFLEEVGTQLGRDRMEVDDQAWIPISAVHANWPVPGVDEPVVTQILYRMSDRSLIAEAESEVRAILAERLRVSADDKEAIGIWSSVEFINKLPLEQTEFIMAVLASATLLIGGIGILNMMLDAVHERRQEIGVRLAVGARRRDILVQFFLETFTITSIGGSVGVALGVGGCLALERLNLPDLIPIPELSAGAVLFSVGVLVSVGLVAGLVPAWRAAKIDPALTLRME